MTDAAVTRGHGHVIGILHAGPRAAEVTLSDRLIELGARVDLVHVREAASHDFRAYGCVLNRVYPSTAFESSKAILDETLRTVTRLEQEGVFVLSGTLSCQADYSKLYAAQLMQDFAVRTPRTMLLTTELAERGPPFLPAVIKPDIGALGRDCVKIECSKDWRASLESSDWQSRPRIVQELVRPVPQVDYRVTVMFGEVPFAYQRTLVDGWFSNNDGPSVVIPAMDTIPPAALDIAVRASQAIGALINGVDVMVDQHGAVIIENNPTPAFSVTNSWKVDVLAERIVRFLNQRT